MSTEHTPKKKRKPSYRKPCPDPPKGQTCLLCRSAYVCGQSARKKITKATGSTSG